MALQTALEALILAVKAVTLFFAPGLLLVFLALLLALLGAGIVLALCLFGAL